jgi:hypothetical protein
LDKQDSIPHSPSLNLSVNNSEVSQLQIETSNYHWIVLGQNLEGTRNLICFYLFIYFISPNTWFSTRLPIIQPWETTLPACQQSHIDHKKDVIVEAHSGCHGDMIE